MFFDSIGWCWEYEPIDLDGYIPDFVSPFPAGPVLIEVKPGFSTVALVDAAGAKLRTSGWSSANENPAMAVGASWNVRGGDAELCAGAIWQVCEGYYALKDDYWADAVWYRCHKCHEISVYHCLGGWDCVQCGAYAADHLRGNVSPEWLERLWREAGTATRWRGPRR